MFTFKYNFKPYYLKIGSNKVKLLGFTLSLPISL